MITEEKLNSVYRERAIASVAFAKMALRLGYKAGVGNDEDMGEWGTILYVDLPEGQMSWHFNPRDVELLEGMPSYDPTWDGTFNGRSIEFVKGLSHETTPAK